MNADQNIENAKNILLSIIAGCQEVKVDTDVHKDAKSLASLIIRDCNKTLAALDGKRLPGS